MNLSGKIFPNRFVNKLKITPKKILTDIPAKVLMTNSFFEGSYKGFFFILAHLGHRAPTGVCSKQEGQI